ncbi:MAG: leucine-rich repeat domain-containing protein, partial [Calditrichia bacterium]
QGLTKLQTLDLRGCQISDAGLRHLKRLTNLQSEEHTSELQSFSKWNLKPGTTIRFFNYCKCL